MGTRSGRIGVSLLPFLSFAFALLTSTSLYTYRITGVINWIAWTLPSGRVYCFLFFFSSFSYASSSFFA